MAVATAIRTDEKVGEWSKIFPSKQVSETQSALFVKKLLAVAVSNITYLRAIFPEHAYGDRCLEDLNLKVLRDDSSCPGACQVIKWVKGCFDALDKKYLKTIVIGIYIDPNYPETIIESYTFKFTYTEDGPSINVYRNNKKITGAKTEAETKKATIRLLRTIVVLTQSLKSLPDDVMMTMKLTYYDDVTPIEYQPPGFRSADSDSFKFEQEPMNIKVGDVSTPFHTVKLRIKTDSSQFEMKDDEDECDEEENVEEDEVKQTEIKTKQEHGDNMEHESVERNYEKEILIEPKEIHEVPDQSPAIPGRIEDVASTPGSHIDSVNDTCEDEAAVKCPCESNEDDGLMIQCDICRFWQHAVCFAVIDENEAPEKHLCNLCVDPNDPNSVMHTDPYLIGQTPIVVQATCLWRRTLLSALDMGRILAPRLARRLDVEITVAQGLITRLEHEGYCQPANKGKRLGKVVNKQLLREKGLKKYFTKGKSADAMEGEEMEAEEEHSSAPINLESKTQSTGTTNMVEQLTHRTDEINLSGRRTTRSQELKNNSQRSHLTTIKEDDMIFDAHHSARPIRNNRDASSRKRAVSVDNEHEFEISNSQDQEQHMTSHGRKHRKASIATKPVLV